MKRRNRVVVFKDRFHYIGPLSWFLSLQYFVIQLLVALAWMTPYSLRANTISDLGNTACGRYGSMLVCSPLHTLMNISFIVLGISIMVGSLLIYQEFRETKGSLVGFSAMGLAGLGTLVVGLFPENTISAAHIFGASLPFLFGNLAMIILGLALKLPTGLKWYSGASGLLGLAGLVLFLTGHDLSLGKGGMERVTAYPQTIWLIIFGVYMSMNRYRQIRRARAI